MIIFLISICAYFVGPLIYQAVQKDKSLISIVDGFIFISILGLVGLHLTELIEGRNVFFFASLLFLGFLGPNLFEKTFSKSINEIHKLIIWVGLAGFLAHVFLEAAALSLISDQLSALNSGIIIHRIPVGLAVWWLIRPKFGKQIASYAIITLILANISGFCLSSYLNLDSTWLIYLQTFLAGSILHVVFFSFHLDGEHASCCQHKKNKQHKIFDYMEGIGNILGIILLIIFFQLHHNHGEHSDSVFLSSVINLLYLSSPALVLAYFLSGFIQAFFSQNSLKWFNQGNNFSRVGKGVLLGLPLPVCSCGVLPFYKTLTGKGLLPAAGLAFLIATPELGIDAILISIPLLGMKLTFFRLLAAIIMAFAVGYFLADFAKTKKTALSESLEEDTKKSTFKKIKSGLYFSFTKLVDHTAPWILAGILLAAVVETYLGHINWNLPYGLDILVASFIGIFLYVCASGATPLVATLIAAGLSPGAGISFLLTGPATNISTFGILSELHGKKFALIFAGTAFIVAVALGFLVNSLIGNISTLSPSFHQHHDWWQHIYLILFILILLSSIFRKGARHFFGELF